MKKLLMLVVFVFVAGAVFASQTDPATGEAKAKIVAPLAITHATGAALNFGTLVSPKNGAGTVTISNANPGQATDSGVERITVDPVSSDHFTVTNPDNVSYSAAVTEASITVKNPNNDEMTVSAFTPSCTSSCTATDIYVGGQLAIGQNQASGVYSGQYHITLTY
ncbi:MAG: DUF4402 domain-containing protein [Elusimicrobiaceae bacterium]|nr:DUF4402 domain-containing protein [Elusimicrobiaceae bacterium]